MHMPDRPLGRSTVSMAAALFVLLSAPESEARQAHDHQARGTASSDLDLHEHHMQGDIFTRVQVSERVWVLYGRGGNIGVIVTGEGVVVVDTQFADIAPAAVEQIRQITDQPIRYVINTHLHGDHVGGNSVLQEYGDIVAQQNTYDRMLQGRDSPDPPQRRDGLPQVTFSEEMRFYLGGVEVDAFHLSRGHTDTDVVVWLPGENVVHMGDLLFNRMVPVVDKGNGAHTGEWQGFLAGVRARIRPDTRVIPGHGEVGGPEAIQGMSGLLTAAQRLVTTRAGEGATREEVVSSPLSAIGQQYTEWAGENRVRRLLGAVWTEAIGNGQTLLVVNKSENTLAFVDVETGDVRGKAPTGPNPHEVAATPDGRFAYVSNYGSGRPSGTRSWLTVVDIQTMRSVREIELKDPESGAYLSAPHGIMVSRDGTDLWVTAEGSRAVARISLPGEDVAAVYPTAQATSHQVVPTPDGSKAYVANIGGGSVSVVEKASGRVTTIQARPGAEGIDVTPDGRWVWVTNNADASICVIDTRTDQVTRTLRAGNRPIRVKFTPDGVHALVSFAGDNGIGVYTVAEGRQISTIHTGTTPVGLLILPDGKQAYVANTASDRVSVLDLESWSVIGVIRPGDEPDGLGLAIRP